MWLLAAATALLLLPVVPHASSWVTTLSYVGLYALPAIGLVLITGAAGMLSFGQAAFMGMGAYASAVLTMNFGMSPWLGLVAGWMLTAACAWVLGAVTLRMSGHYLPIATLAWGFAITIAFSNLDFLGRNDGLTGIQPVTLGPVSLQSQAAIYYLIWLAVFLAAALARNYLNSKPGRAILALKGGSTMPEAMGIDTVAAKRTVFVIAALLSSTSGWLYAHMVRSVSPSAFAPHHSLELVFMTAIGGASSIVGAVLGAGIVVLAKDLLQSHLPNIVPVSGNFESVVLGVAMVILLVKARDGAWPYIAGKLGLKDPTVVLPASDESGATSATSRGGRLEVKKVLKRFGGLVAVNEVSLEVTPGEIVSLIGPNGAGKSTTFNLITGVLRIDQGEIRFNGEDIGGLSSREVSARGILRTFQHVKLVPHLSVIENIAIGAHRHGRSSALKSLVRLDRSEERQILRTSETAARRAGLGDVMFNPAGTLSLGQQRLVEIARALAGRPALLLLDEPAAGLRHNEKIDLAKLLRELRADGMSILLVEHDMQFVMDLVDRIFVLDFGTPIAAGTPAAIQQSDVVRRAYLGAD